MNRFWKLSIILLALAAPAYGQSELVHGYVTKVLDGDTLRICEDRSGYSCNNVRVNNLNTPEKKLCSPATYDKASSCERCKEGSALGLKASKYAEKLFAENNGVTYKRVNMDRYGRVVADVFIAGGDSYLVHMIDRGLGVPYPCPNGRCVQRPRPWCE